MKKVKAENVNLQKMAVGTKELLSAFYAGEVPSDSPLKKAIDNPGCEVCTTTMNIAELYHLIKEKEGNDEKFNEIYSRIKSCIKIEKYCLDKSFESEYAKNYSNKNIFDFTLIKFCEDSNILNVL